MRSIWGTIRIWRKQCFKAVSFHASKFLFFIFLFWLKFWNKVSVLLDSQEKILKKSFISALFCPHCLLESLTLHLNYQQIYEMKYSNDFSLMKTNMQISEIAPMLLQNAVLLKFFHGPICASFSPQSCIFLWHYSCCNVLCSALSPWDWRTMLAHPLSAVWTWSYVGGCQALRIVTMQRVRCKVCNDYLPCCETLEKRNISIFCAMLTVLFTKVVLSLSFSLICTDLMWLLCFSLSKV